MVKKIATFFAYLVFFIATLLYFMPKVNLYYFLEEELKKEEIVISHETLKDKGFVLNIKDAEVFVKSISSAVISEADIKVFVIYNKISLKDIELSLAVKSFLPLHLDEVELVYSIFNPLNINIQSSGEFGKLDGSFDLLSMALHLKLKPSKMMIENNARTLKNLLKDKNGEFSYDKNF